MRPQRKPTLLSVLVAVVAGVFSSDARADDDPPRITHTPVQQVVRGQPLTVSATMTDESEIFAPTLYFRSPDAEGYESVMMPRQGDVYTAQIPVKGDVLYWIEAYDEYGNGPSRNGTPGSPHRVTVVDRVARTDQAPATSSEPAPANQPARPGPFEVNLEPMVAPPEDPFLLPVEPKPAYKQWWFITGAGVVGAAAVGVLVYALQPDDVHRNTFGATVTRP